MSILNIPSHCPAHKSTFFVLVLFWKGLSIHSFLTRDSSAVLGLFILWAWWRAKTLPLNSAEKKHSICGLWRLIKKAPFLIRAGLILLCSFKGHTFCIWLLILSDRWYGTVACRQKLKDRWRNLSSVGPFFGHAKKPISVVGCRDTGVAETTTQSTNHHTTTAGCCYSLFVAFRIDVIQNTFISQG